MCTAGAERMSRRQSRYREGYGMSKCRTSSIVNWKGGVGKTTIAYHLGTGLEMLEPEHREEHLGSEEVPRVLLVDNDAQCNLTIACVGSDQFEKMLGKGVKTMKDLYKEFLENDTPVVKVEEYILEGVVRRNGSQTFERIDLLPAHPDLVYTDMSFAIYSRADFKESMSGPPMYKFRVLDRILEQVRDRYDFIFIDCPPSMHYLTQNAIYASDYYIIPTLPDWFSAYGLHSIVAKVQEFNRWWDLAGNGRYRATELVGIIPNNVKEYNQEPIQSQAAIINGLRERYGDLVFYNYLTNGDGIPRALHEAQPVYTLAGSGGSAAKQTKLLRRILVEFLDRIAE